MSTSDDNGPDAERVIRGVEYAVGEEFPTTTRRELIDRIAAALREEREKGQQELETARTERDGYERLTKQAEDLAEKLNDENDSLRTELAAARQRILELETEIDTSRGYL